MNLVTLNVGGKVFQLSEKLIEKIPYIFTMISGCETLPTLENPLFIERSSFLFDHVYAFIVDQHHPYPMKYAYELDFYDISYEKDQLYNSHYSIEESLDRCEKYLDICEKINKSVKEEVGVIYSVSKTAYKYQNTSSKKCIRCNCGVGKNRCNECKELCPYNKICKNKVYYSNGTVPLNYCEAHLECGQYCKTYNCGNVRIPGKLSCFRCTY